MRRLLLTTIVLTACGSSSPQPLAQVANKCAVPRTGTDPVTGQAYPDRPGSLDDEKSFLRAWTDDLYLWYREVPNADPKQYATAIDYFNVLKTPAITPSGNPKDRFHFTSPTAQWEQLSQSGVEAGYGVQWVLIAARPPRKLVVAYVEPGSPAAGKIDRGADIQKIDGVAVVDGSPAPLNAGLFPASVGDTHTFEFKDVAGATHTVALTSANVTHQPVQNVKTLAGGVGYMLFNDHLATAEKALVDAVTQLQGVNDLVLDIRYNGGGYLDIASELAYMIAGPGPTASKFFEQTKFNDKHQTTDPYSGRQLAPTPFHKTSVGLSVNQGQALPHLDRPRVFVLTGGSTCSASESVINGLRGVDVQVIQIGGTTCGKPYGFVPQDNCGTTYFSIQFQGVNAKGFGDYPDGFEPAGTTAAGVPGCKVADDFAHALGDPSEARLAAALRYRTSQTCPPASASAARALAMPGGDGQALRNIWRENRWQ